MKRYDDVDAWLVDRSTWEAEASRLRAILDDPDGVLEERGENTRAARRALPEREEPELVGELQERLDADPALKAAYEGLTPGRQRHSSLHISGPKQAKARRAPVEKQVDRTLAGKGLEAPCT